MAAEALQIDHPEVRTGRLVTIYQRESDWEFDSNRLPPVFQQSKKSILSWLREEQGWQFEGFNLFINPDNPPQAESQFVFRTDNPPLLRKPFPWRFFPFMPGSPSKKASYLNLEQVLKPEKSSGTSSHRIGESPPSWNRRIVLNQVEPFSSYRTILSNDPPKNRFFTKSIYVLPFLLYSADTSSVIPTSEDPSRLVVHIILSDVVPLLREAVKNQEETLGKIRQNLEIAAILPNPF